MSISIAAYNVEKYIVETLNSLIEADRFDQLDIIVINDGSKDKTGQIAVKYAEKYPDSIRCINKENGGHGSTINVGIEHAVGKYFMCLDGDDWMDSEQLDRLIGCMENADTELILFNFVIRYETGETKYSKHYKNFSFGVERSICELGIQTSIELHSSAIKTELLRESRYRCLEDCFYEDTQYCAYLIILAKNFAYYDVHPYQYRKGRFGQSMSVESRQKNIGMAERVCDELVRIWRYETEGCLPGQRDAVLKKVLSIEVLYIYTMLSFVPNRDTRNALKVHIARRKQMGVDEHLRKYFPVYSILSRVFPYRAMAMLYRWKKHYK